MNRLWNVMVNLIELEDKDLWTLFWFYEVIGVIFSIGCVTVASWIVDLMIGTPNWSELLIGFTLIYVVTEQWLIGTVLGDFIDAYKGEWRI